MEILKKAGFLALLVLLVVGIVGGCGKSGGAEPEGYHKITAEQAKQMMDTKKVTIVDVRTEAEYKDGHVPGAMLLPVESIGDSRPAKLPDPGATLLVYCRSGHRSGIAARKLAEMGYKNVYDFGGINSWPYSVEK